MAETEEEIALAEPIGTRLRAAREAQGLTLDDIAAKTRVPIRHLQHMEREEWDELPAATYSVGFARAYANAVGLNGSEIGAELRGQLGSAPLVATPQYEPADPARVPPRALAITAAIIALLLAGAYLLWRSWAVEDPPIAGIETLAEPAAETAVQPLPAAAAPVPAASGPVVLTATDEVWLRVYEAGGGPTLYENILQAGQRYVVPQSAQRPMILTGRPNALRVTVGSQAIPPLGPAERTISDVSLLPQDLLAAEAAAPAAQATQQPATQSSAAQPSAAQPSAAQAPVVR